MNSTQWALLIVAPVAVVMVGALLLPLFYRAAKGRHRR